MRKLFLRMYLSVLGLGLATICSAQPDPLYDATVDTVFDIITTDDPSALTCVEPLGRGDRQIWDKRVNGEPVVSAYLFNAHYSDGTTIEIAINPEFGSVDAARDQALRFATPLGRLPTVLRQGLARFSLHKGREGFHAGTGQVVFYEDTATTREEDAHLEESLFHEAVHASLDAAHRLAPEWIQAQQADGRFLTRYGAETPEREDLAETALFAFAILHHPDRFPPVDTAETERAIPNRLAYIARHIFPPGDPLVFQVAEPMTCSIA